MKTSIVKTSIVSVCVAGGLIAIGSAQQAAPSEARRATAELMAQAGGMARVALETRVTKGAPYSADAVTEFVQTLSDGNRIVRRTTTRLYRDTEGRTRREVVSEVPAGSERTTVVITDPVAGVSFILDPEARTAQRSPAMWAKMAGGTIAVGGWAGRGGGGGLTAEGGAVSWTTAGGEPSEPDAKVRIEMTNKIAELNTALNVMRERADGRKESKEDLGQQLVEGVLANGTRTTTVVPAGAIGNEQPLTTVSEQWFSPELEVLVLTRHSDPRVGETTYKLTNILRAEPDRSLFQPPADYTVREPVMRGRGGPPQ